MKLALALIGILAVAAARIPMEIAIVIDVCR